LLGIPHLRPIVLLVARWYTFNIANILRQGVHHWVIRDLVHGLLVG
jgi:hypothetical protein